MSHLEKEILGCFLKDNTLLKETLLKGEYFKDAPHQAIFNSMAELVSEGKAVDKVTLLSANYKMLEQLGGVSFITRLETIGNIENFETYESSLIDDFKKRESERIAQEWLSQSEKDNQELIKDLSQLDELGYVDEKDKNELLQELMFEPYQEAKKGGIPSGLTDLDKITGGFRNQNSYIMGARPSMGKTATMLKFMLAASKNGAVPVVFSLEMSMDSLLRRLIAAEGKINSFIARNPIELTDGKKLHWEYAVNELYKLDFEIYDKPMQTIEYMRSKVRKARNKYEDKQIFVLIDYLTLIDHKGKFHSDHAKVSDISAKLKAMAKEFDCPVMTLAQLSRGVESRQDKRPMLSDLRESGSIEQDADMVMFLYRDSYYNEMDDNTLEINIAKHRDGPTGTAEVYYNKSTGILGDLIAH